MERSWAITSEKISAALGRIIDLAHPRKVILFGSAARDPSTARDLDLLVVMQGEVPSPRAESVRLRRALRGISMAVDLVVISESVLRKFAATPGLIYREALASGRMLYEAA
jgi:predicted nucleotidyltransferase